MAQIAMMELQVDIKSRGDEVFNIFMSKAYLFPKICPDKIKKIKLVEGDWNSVGSVKARAYVIEVSMTGAKTKVGGASPPSKF